MPARMHKKAGTPQPPSRMREELACNRSLPAETRIAALTALAKWAKPSEALSIVNRLDIGEAAYAELLPVVLGCINKLDLDALPEDQRPETAWRLSECIRTGKNDTVIAACCAKLDTRSVENLCKWLIEARRQGLDDVSDENGLAVYAGAGGKGGNVKRSAEIGHYVQRRLIDLLKDGTPERIRDPVELQYLVQAMGPLQTQSAAFYNAAFDKVEHLLERWKEDQTIVVTAINTYVAMWPRATAPHAPEILCDILRDHIGLLDSKVAAAKGLGSLRYAAAVPELIEIAIDKEEMLNVRVAAIASLSKMPYNKENIARIRALLRGLLQRMDPRDREPADIIRASLRGFAQVGFAEEAAVLFPWTLDHEQNIPGIAATSAMIQRSPTETPRIVRAFLEWLVDQKVGNLFLQPEHAITNMADYLPEQADRVRGEVQKALLETLEDLRKNPPNERVQKLADTLLRDLERTKGAAETRTEP